MGNFYKQVLERDTNTGKVIALPAFLPQSGNNALPNMFVVRQPQPEGKIVAMNTPLHFAKQ